MSAAQRPVLIVDDDIDIREALTDTLEDHGMRVVAAANGRDALRLVRHMDAPPAAILLDLMMPIMDGYAFLSARELDPRLKAIPVAVITAGQRVEAERFIDNAPLISKPIDVPYLLGILHQFFLTRTAAP